MVVEVETEVHEIKLVRNHLGTSACCIFNLTYLAQDVDQFLTGELVLRISDGVSCFALTGTSFTMTVVRVSKPGR